MGTRHLICVVQNGAFKVAQYGQWDGYPSGQGIGILEFLRGANMELFRERVAKCRFVTDDELKAAYAPYSTDGWMTVEQSKAFAASPFGHLSRDTGSDILGIIADSPKGKLLKDSSAFAGDSLFCEWAYVIDLDANKLEVYQGFKNNPVPAGERFAHLNPDPSDVYVPKYDGDERYYPVQLCATFDIGDLPTDEAFCKACEPQEEDEAPPAPTPLDALKKVREEIEAHWTDEQSRLSAQRRLSAG